MQAISLQTKLFTQQQPKNHVRQSQCPTASLLRRPRPVVPATFFGNLPELSTILIGGGIIGSLGVFLFNFFKFMNIINNKHFKKGIKHLEKRNFGKAEKQFNKLDEK